MRSEQEGQCDIGIVGAVAFVFEDAAAADMSSALNCWANSLSRRSSSSQSTCQSSSGPAS